MQGTLGSSEGSPNTLYHTCIEKYGIQACGLIPVEGEDHRYRLEIGDARWNRSLDSLRAEPLVLHEWGSTLGLPKHRWSYTITTMAIFDDNAGHVYLVDMTGRGYTDTCGKKLIAASEEPKWKEWGDDDLMKMYRFYLFRMLGFGVANHDLQNHVNNEIEKKSSKKANQDVNPMPTTTDCYSWWSRNRGGILVNFRRTWVAQTFYCEYILNGVISWAGDEFTSACHLVFPETADRKRIARAKEIMQNEMSTFVAAEFELSAF
ncbi:unnamed protein product [Heligmosomoides polygyrus]|uniref:Pkinase_fungal domain-containing protein n=1 Tax=Heligmosomoides polygyrus TaxID=6339 RepID=A0A183GPF0_HELPZ|nr:unnamed protein product [Heligmosomoides polygyrus]